MSRRVRPCGRPLGEASSPRHPSLTFSPQRTASTVAGIKGGVSGRLQLFDHSTQQAVRETVPPGNQAGVDTRGVVSI